MTASPLNATIIEKQLPATPVPSNNPFSNPEKPPPSPNNPFPNTSHDPAPSEYSTDSDAEVNISHSSASSSESALHLNLKIATPPSSFHPSNSQFINSPSSSNLVTAVENLIGADTTERRTSSRTRNKIKKKSKNEPSPE